MKQVNSDSLTS